MFGTGCGTLLSQFQGEGGWGDCSAWERLDFSRNHVDVADEVEKHVDMPVAISEYGWSPVIVLQNWSLVEQ